MVCCRCVPVEDRKIKKPFLGGWRHKITKVDYFNAESQTGPQKISKKEKCSRGVQYISWSDVYVQTRCHHRTQTWRPDLFLPRDTDKYLTSKPYETYEEMMKRLDYDGKARIIQRNYRIYKLLKNIKEYARQYRELVANCEQYEAEKALLYRKRHQQEILRRLNPKTRSDFDMLYYLVEKWRKDRLECVKQRFFRPGRCAASYAILNKTVDMLKVIEQKRLALTKRYRNRKRVKFITENCKPIQWTGYKGMLIEMNTLRNQKARELNMLYDSLTNYEVTRGERIEILTMLKKSLEVHNCVAAFDLICLLDQELTYLAREMKGMSLEHFRGRIVCKEKIICEILAYNVPKFIRESLVNFFPSFLFDNADSYLNFLRSSHSCCCTNNDKDFCKNVNDEKLHERIAPATKLCRSCSKLLPINKFTVHGRMKKLTICIGCTSLRERNISHISYEPYVHLLCCVRSEEKKKESLSAITFAMQKHDMYHLVNNIWHGCSVVSENRDLFKLKMVRFDANEEWSPWNCILLTEEEAEVHSRLKDPETVYSKPLIEQILLSHQLAKNQFKHLRQFEKEFREQFHQIEGKAEYKPAIKVDDYLYT